MSKKTTFILLILSTLLVFVYPFVFFTNWYTIVAGLIPKHHLFLTIVAYSFIVVSTIYPATLTIAWKFYLKQSETDTSYLAWLPIGNLLLVFAIYAIWYVIEVYQLL